MFSPLTDFLQTTLPPPPPLPPQKKKKKKCEMSVLHFIYFNIRNNPNLSIIGEAMNSKSEDKQFYVGLPYFVQM